MTVGEKIKKLRTDNGLTQDEFAEKIYVTRTAVSKWESDRGFPNIDSLKAISKYFSVSLDELLSGDEILVIAEDDHKQKERTLQDLVFGLLDCGMSFLLFLPFFGQKTDGVIREVSLIALCDIQPYLKTAYVVFVGVMVVLGIMMLAFQNYHQRFCTHSKSALSLVLSVVGVCLFIISQQPYAAVFVFLFLVIKALMMLKR
ncbi:MAG: helix-turn-helix transcriptional regulator [Clostridia bacterium]|nr:helix-turn-helix transcriptional regulator [Clostridia bacterium]